MGTRGGKGPAGSEKVKSGTVAPSTKGTASQDSVRQQGVVTAQPSEQNAQNGGGSGADNGAHPRPDDDEGGEAEEGCCCSVYCCRMVCWFFCCPPIPSRIVAKQAFLPPNPPAYEIDEADGELKIRVEVEGSSPVSMVTVQQAQRHGATVSVYRIPNGPRKVLAAHLVKNPAARYTLLLSHGNAVDIGQLLPYMLDLSERVGCSIFTYDYSGYGLSSGVAREANQYRDVAVAYRYLIGPLSVPPTRVVFYGMSIGSSPSVHLAAKLCKLRDRAESRPVRSAQPDPPPAAVVLHSPVASGIRVLRPACTLTICCDPFQNLHKVQRITLPTLVIHGERDDVVPVAHGKMLHASLPNAVHPLWLPKANHNNIEAYKQYYDRLRAFFAEVQARQLAEASLQKPVVTQPATQPVAAPDPATPTAAAQH